MLITAEDRFASRPDYTGKIAEATVDLFWHRWDQPKPVAGAFAVGVTLTAVVNRGRWIVQCPHCAGAQFAAVTDPRFFCVDCCNVAYSGLWVKVSFPDTTTRSAIEALLIRRPERRNMNWEPTETLADLALENTVQGVH